MKQDSADCQWMWSNFLSRRARREQVANLRYAREGKLETCAMFEKGAFYTPTAGGRFTDVSLR